MFAQATARLAQEAQEMTQSLKGPLPQAVNVAPLPSPPADEDTVIYTVNDLLLERLQNIGTIPIVGYPNTTRGCDDYHFYTIAELLRFCDGSITTLLKQGLPLFKADETTTENKVVALLGASDLDYMVSIFALTRMGYAVLLLSTRLATEAYVALLEKTKCSDILFTSGTAKAVEGITSVKQVNTFQIPAKDQYDIDVDPKSIPAPQSGPAAAKRISFIVHSSGSTGLPKPIFQTHAACLNNYSTSKGYRAFLTLPLYHNHGISTFFRAVFKGKPIAFQNANLPLTGPNLLKAMNAVQPESFHGVPYALKLLSEIDGGTEILAKCEQVLFGGSSCPDVLGDKLVAGGVNVVAHYGATEMGQLMTSYRPAGDKAWNYLRPFPAVAPYLWFAPQGDGTFECVVLDGLPSKVTFNCSEPPNSFRTSDTFWPHPTIPNAWKYIGRIDDRVTLMNGEKVLPIPIENRVRKSEYVKEVLVFGVAKAAPGMMIFPSEQCADLSKDEILKRIWPDIAAANTNAEAFSQISEDMTVIMNVGADYPATDKGTLIRAASYRKFADIIEAVYQNAENGGDGEKQALDITGITTFLLKLFQDFGVDEETDFYNAGVDSLQGIKARATILKTLDLGTAKLGSNVIYEYPSVKQLAAHLYSLRTGEEVKGEDEIDAMADLVDKYSSFKRPAVEDVVLVTGATGTLGVHILNQLLRRETVKKVYCLVRASNADQAYERVLATLSARGFSLTGTRKIVALPADISQPTLGLGESVIEELQNTLTKVIHSAWAVNFNLGVRTFEQIHIKGVHNLINLCLSTKRAPAQFYFCSSISAAAGTPIPANIAEASIPELKHAQTMGYARSKLVAERIVEAAAEKTGMVAKVLRVGQIVGDCEVGTWNPTEAIPLMFQTAVTMKALPALEETPSWLPVDVVARIILELSDTQTPEKFDSRVTYNLQNPRTFHWTHDLLPALKNAGLEFEIVSQREWVNRLRNSEPDPKKNPTIKLVDFFAEKYDNDRPGRKGLVFETHRTEEASQSLRGGFDIIGSGIVEKFVREWKKVW